MRSPPVPRALILWLAPSLSAAQIDHLAAKYAKTNKEWEADWLRGTPAERLQRRLKQAVERTDMLYGSLNEAQTQLLRAELAASSFNPQMLWSERLRRQETSCRRCAGSTAASCRRRPRAKRSRRCWRAW